jgi:hypothetical protein
MEDRDVVRDELMTALRQRGSQSGFPGCGSSDEYDHPSIHTDAGPMQRQKSALMRQQGQDRIEQKGADIAQRNRLIGKNRHLAPGRKLELGYLRNRQTQSTIGGAFQQDREIDWIII